MAKKLVGVTVTFHRHGHVQVAKLPGVAKKLNGEQVDGLLKGLRAKYGCVAEKSGDDVVVTYNPNELGKGDMRYHISCCLKSFRGLLAPQAVA